jgi:hypothetical protein
VNFGDFPTFGPASQQLEQANNLLSAAGLSKQKGEWVMENGDPLHLELVSTAETPDVELATLQQLGRAGIGGELNTVDDAVYTERASNYPLQYGVTLGGWSQIGNQIQSATTVYHNALRWRGYYADQRNIWERDLIQEQVDAGNLEWIQPSEEGKEPVRVKKYAPDQVEAFTIQAPPPGDWDGALQDIPIITRGQGATTQTEQDVRAHQVEMGWYRLFDMPDIPIYETWNQSFQKREGWLLPDSDSEWWTQTPNEQISAGQISADPDAQ